MTTSGAVLLLLVLAVLTVVVAAVVVHRRRGARSAAVALDRDELTRRAEQHRTSHGREHGQNPSVARSADRGGWG